MTYATFSEKLEALQLGYMESDNRPTPIPLSTINDGRKTVGQKGMWFVLCGIHMYMYMCLYMYIHTACQMWLLGRLLPFLIGTYIPHDDDRWLNYLLMLEVVDLLFAPEITMDEVAYAHILIVEHHEGFVQCYPHSRPIPKHHFMIHMARLISM